ncbi:MAG: TylF/MycF family methyltransferase [Bacteroidota bacterium]|nr:TylF/MycF family methyltransferase [Bacteroidota bacterium]
MNKTLQKAYHTISHLLAGKKLHLIKSLSFLNRPRRINLERLDYIRISCLELIAEEIYQKKLPGNVAELGVYQGDFAKDINQVFPDRKLYLFDTFEGFDIRDVSGDISRGFSAGDQDFSKTSVNLVLSKMPIPKNCIIKQGYFPQSAVGVEDTFCFVSIDADLYEPILAGLHFFYPRLCRGGYIFVHDFNNSAYPGAAEAIKEFCRQYQCSYVPVADNGGTAIIAK